MDCGESDPIVLEFDHVQGKKRFSISECIYQNWSIEDLEKEMNKCEIRCANCHRRKTAKERDSWYKIQSSSELVAKIKGDTE